MKYEIRWNNNRRVSVVERSLCYLSCTMCTLGNEEVEENFSSSFEKNILSLNVTCHSSVTFFDFTRELSVFFKSVDNRRTSLSRYQGKKREKNRVIPKLCEEFVSRMVERTVNEFDTFFRVTLYAQVPSCTRVYSLLRTRT